MVRMKPEIIWWLRHLVPILPDGLRGWLEAYD
jgi:hypothetical protein